MFSLLISPTSNLPTVVSQKSHDYADLIMVGYTEEATGNKNAMLDLEKEKLEEIYGEMVND